MVTQVNINNNYLILLIDKKSIYWINSTVFGRRNEVGELPVSRDFLSLLNSYCFALVTSTEFTHC